MTLPSVAQRIAARSRSISLKDIVLTIAVFPFVGAGFVAGLVVGLLRLALGALQVGYESGMELIHVKVAQRGSR